MARSRLTFRSSVSLPTKLLLGAGRLCLPKLAEPSSAILRSLVPSEIRVDHLLHEGLAFVQTCFLHTTALFTGMIRDQSTNLGCGPWCEAVPTPSDP
jgi:hypothetical protein